VSDMFCMYCTYNLQMSTRRHCIRNVCRDTSSVYRDITYIKEILLTYCMHGMYNLQMSTRRHCILNVYRDTASVYRDITYILYVLYVSSTNERASALHT